MASYRDDPYWTTAKFDSTTRDGKTVLKGERIFYYPKGRVVLIGEAAEQASRDFEAARFDESMMTGEW